jgi:hypothetical protein
MAVVQISRIQVRRGKENSGSGLPQLASGEMAWSVDAQNLWIGNGSVAEGAPFVGNTKILTQNDLSSNGNILDLISYQYKKNDYTIVTGTQGANYPFVRAIQSKIDEIQTSVHDFGALGDGITDDTAAIQLAINQLFLNNLNLSSVSGRVTLKFPAGLYITSATIYVPSYASLEGAGKGKTVIKFNNTASTPGPVFQFVNDTALPGVPRIFSMPTIARATYNPIGSAGTTVRLTRADALSGTTGIVAGMVVTGTGFNVTAHTVISVDDSSTITVSSAPDTGVTPTGVLTFTAASAPAPTYLNQPRNISIKHLTAINNTVDQYGIRLDAVRDSEFENLSIQGAWGGTFTETSAGIYLTAFSRVVTCQGNTFRNIDINGFSYAVYSNNDIQYNRFKSLSITDTRSGIIFGRTSDLSSLGQLYGPSYNEIFECYFDSIKQHAIYVYNGTGNTSQNSRVNNVGNNGGSNITTAAYPQIYYATPGNTSIGDQSKRTQDLATTIPSVSTTYNPSGSAGTTLVVTSTTSIAIGMVVSGTGYTSSQVVTAIVNATTLTISASPNTTPSGTLVFSIPYYPEVGGLVSFSSYGANQIAISNITSSTFAFRLPIPTDAVGYVINYVYRSTNRQQSRRGQLTIMADIANALVQVSDEYDYVQYASTSEDTLLAFSAQILNKSLNVSYVNNSTGDTGTVIYSYSVVF